MTRLERPRGKPRWGTAIERLLERIRIEDDCWMWTGSGSTRKNKPGGQFWPVSGGPRVHVQRYAYEHWVGEIPAGAEIKHTCGRGLCVNPDHLYPVTRVQWERWHKPATAWRMASAADRYDAKVKERDGDVADELARLLGVA